MWQDRTFYLALLTGRFVTPLYCSQIRTFIFYSSWSLFLLSMFINGSFACHIDGSVENFVSLPLITSYDWFLSFFMKSVIWNTRKHSIPSAMRPAGHLIGIRYTPLDSL